MGNKKILVRSILASIIWIVIGILFNLLDLLSYLHSIYFLIDIVEGIVFVIFMFFFVSKWTKSKNKS